MKNILTCAVILVAALCLTSGVYAQNVVESYGDAGSIDWSAQVVRATGIAITGGVGGRPGQIRAAEMDALRQILATVKGMRLNSETTMENFMLSSDVVRTQVEGVVRNFRRVGDPVYMSNGDIEVTVEMALQGPGKIFDIAIPQPIGIPPTPISGTPSSTEVYSGLIVDARGLGVRPAIAPNIYSESGDEIFGSRYIDREWAIKHGMVSYAKDPAKARADERISPNPMFIKAMKASGPNRTDIIVSNQNALTLNKVTENLKFLQECRVILIVD
ncbi:MAG: hypothetical protein P9L92_08825 [Candidatus Electryonea clarkiae]|nr:hypothetical protein [Candidatus Electryonea clarkiae]MDP8286326.1 hypothetical protein [Candidatus Electryonea clarkiae]